MNGDGRTQLFIQNVNIYIILEGILLAASVTMFALSCQVLRTHFQSTTKPSLQVMFTMQIPLKRLSLEDRSMLPWEHLPLVILLPSMNNFHVNVHH